MKMKPWLWAFLGLAISISGCQMAGRTSNQPAGIAQDPNAACQRVAKAFQHPGTTVDAATYVAAGFVPPRSADLGQANTVGESFCRVLLTSRPTAGSDIKSEIWLPPEGRWNGRFLAAGGGGNTGQIVYSRLVDGLSRGYAVLQTDNGHVGKSVNDQAWAIGHPEKVIDFGHRAQAVTAVAGKEAIRTFYGQPARKSYWIGCSQGGGKGLMQAQRYPENFDGIVAGAPVFDWVGSQFAPAWVAVPGMRDSAQFVPKSKHLAIHRKVLAACDAQDGLADGLLQNPVACKFDPASMACPAGQDGADCLTPGQLTAMNRYYSPITRSNGEEVLPGFPKGSEHSSALLGIDKPANNWAGFWPEVVYEDPAYDIKARIDITGLSDYDRARAKVGAAYDAIDPNLEPFANRGGKLIVWHGWHDQLVSALRTESYVKAVNERVGTARADTFMRTYMAPGVNHCRGGVGPIPDEYNLLEKVVNWVEKGEAPGAVTAMHRNARGEVDRTMPLCPYPQVARYHGTGDPNVATSFACQAP